MNEQEWLTSNDPQTMLRACLSHTTSGAVGFVVPGELGTIAYRPSDRKLRLFACACCRQVWDGTVCPSPNNCNDLWECGVYQCGICRGTGKVGGLTDPRSRRAVEVAECFADGLATEEQLSGHHRNWGPCESSATHAAEWAITSFVADPPVMAALLRDIVGNPWRTISLYNAMALDTRTSNDHRWFYGEWLTPTVRHVAQAVYDGRAWDRMGELADALEEAGATDAAILNHCRGKVSCPCSLNDSPHMIQTVANPAESRWERCDVWHRERNRPGGCDGTGYIACNIHARGCWVLDLILGRE